jgi:DNA invertase Pin-like site-specific DNA recombinase
MLIGYARVSKSETQDTARQIRTLKDAGCARLFEEAASGGRWERPELHKMLDQLRSGDTLSSGSSTACPGRSKTF